MELLVLFGIVLISVLFNIYLLNEIKLFKICVESMDDENKAIKNALKSENDHTVRIMKDYNNLSKENNKLKKEVKFLQEEVDRNDYNRERSRDRYKGIISDLKDKLNKATKYKTLTEWRS